MGGGILSGYGTSRVRLSRGPQMFPRNMYRRVDRSKIANDRHVITGLRKEGVTYVVFQGENVILRVQGLDC